MSAAVTMKEIARLAGVTRPVVSAVLNGSRTVKVSEQKREYILALIKNMGYRPNLSARALNGKSTRTIGCVFNNFNLPVEQEFLSSLGYVLAAQSYALRMLSMVNPMDIDRAISDFAGSGLDGIIYQSAADFSDLQERHSIPMIAFMQSDYEYEIGTDVECGYRMLVEHLTGHGHRRVAFIGNSLKIRRFQVESFRKAILGAGLPYRDEYTINLTWNPDFSMQIDDLVGREKITAFLTSNDFIAVNLISYLKNRGIRVPEDVAVCGFDGDNYANSGICRITTAIQPMREMARKSVEMLMEKVNSGSKGIRAEKVLLKPLLHIGDSCGCKSPANKFICWEGIPPTLENACRFIKQAPE